MSREDEIWEMSDERIREIQEDADSKLYIFQASLTDTDRAIINRVMQQRFELLSEVARLRREIEDWKQDGLDQRRTDPMTAIPEPTEEDFEFLKIMERQYAIALALGGGESAKLIRLLSHFQREIREMKAALWDAVDFDYLSMSRLNLAEGELADPKDERNRAGLEILALLRKLEILK